MSQNIFYCKAWSLAYKEPSDLWNEKKARKKHESGELYTVLIGSDVKPSCFVAVMKNKGWVNVGFLDHELREYSYYTFKVINDSRLFLSMAVYREFAENEGEGAGILNVSGGTTYIFKEDGETVVRKEQFNPYKLEDSEMMFDVSGNYDKFPEFGEYDLLIRKRDNIIATKGSKT